MRFPIFKATARLFPGLGDKLVLAGIFEKPEEFVKKSFLIAFYLTTFIVFILTIIFIRFQIVKGFLFLVFPILLVLLFVNFVKRPDIIIKKKQREFDREIVFAGKFLVIELQSGVPIYNAMLSVSKSYPIIGKYFREIINRVNIGTPLEDAINESIELTPSQNFRKLLWQLFNSLKTGSDVAAALGTTIDQLAAAQIIQVKEYGRKLNPLIMFYMVAAVIFPSIGVIMLIVFSSFFSSSISLVVLMLIAFLVVIVQLLFLSVIRSQRPAIGLQ